MSEFEVDPKCIRCGETADDSPVEGKGAYCYNCNHFIDSDGYCEDLDCPCGYPACPTCLDNINVKPPNDEGHYWCENDNCPDDLFREDTVEEVFVRELGDIGHTVEDWRYVGEDE